MSFSASDFDSDAVNQSLFKQKPRGKPGVFAVCG
jgi:hypothetical protein